MKRSILLTILILLFSPALALADRVTLNSSETLAVPTSATLDWQVSLIDAKGKILKVDYQWLDSTLTPIHKSPGGNTWLTWTCRDRDAQLVANCTAPGEPYPCCTGPGAGTGCDPGSTCFTDVFGFVIRSQDVGTKIGLGLRTLVWNKFKADVLTTGNTGTFE